MDTDSCAFLFYQIPFHNTLLPGESEVFRFYIANTRCTNNWYLKPDLSNNFSCDSKVSMKQTLKLFGLLLIMAFSFTASSCSDDKNDEPSAVVGKISITNSSSYTLSGFIVNFTNDKGEIITREQKGTVKPKDKISVDIPIGATMYYMGTSLQGTYFFSPDYSVSVRNQVLTDQIVGNWTSN